MVQSPLFLIVVTGLATFLATALCVNYQVVTGEQLRKAVAWAFKVVGAVLALCGVLAAVAASACMIALVVLLACGLILTVSVAIFLYVLYSREAPVWTESFYRMTLENGTKFFSGVVGTYAQLLYGATTRYAVAMP